MLVKLLPENIARHWDFIKIAIEQAIPIEYLRTHDRMNKILEGLLSDQMQAWFATEDGPGYTDFPPVIALLITTIYVDSVTNAKALCLYCLYAYDNVPMTVWSKSWEVLSRFAKGNKCSLVEAYVDNPTLIKMANEAGWNTQRTYIYKELENET